MQVGTTQCADAHRNRHPPQQPLSRSAAQPYGVDGVAYTCKQRRAIVCRQLLTLTGIRSCNSRQYCIIMSQESYQQLMPYLGAELMCRNNPAPRTVAGAARSILIDFSADRCCPQRHATFTTSCVRRRTDAQTHVATSVGWRADMAATCKGTRDRCLRF